MTKEPRFSVILPVHNGEPYIRTAIESVLSQTYPASDIVILENASTDSTLATLETFSDPRLRVIPSERFLSIEENWQRILDLQLEEYITTLGHDDLLYPDFLSEMAALIEHHPDASLYHAHFYLIDSEGRHIRPCWPIPKHETGNDYMRAVQQLRRDSYGTGYVARSTDYKQVEGLPPFPRLMYADHIAWYRLASLRGKICSPKYLFEYRRHAESAASLTSLLDLYHASKEYMAALATTHYFESVDNISATKGYIEYIFNGFCHRKLADLIYNGTSESLDAFRQVKKQFIVEAEKDKLFHVYDTACKVYEGLATIPIRPLRKLMFQPIELIRSYRQLQRENPH